MPVLSEIGEYIDLEEFFNAKRPTFVLRIRGDSMIDDHLCDGDYVVIERKDTARNGEQAVVLLTTGECTLKRYFLEGDNVRLQPCNASMEPRILPKDSVKVQGVVIGVLRSYA